MMKLANPIKGKISPEAKYILGLFFATRIILTIIGCFSHIILDPRLPPRKYDLVFSKYLWLDIWGVWDTGWYVDIATNGYTLSSQFAGLEHQSNYAFFPLYPMLMRFLGTIIGDYYVAGLILSNIFLLIACTFLYKLVRLDAENETALRSVKYLFLFPNAFIFSGVFTEPLFLALVLICFYYAKKGNWPAVGLNGFLVSLTRPNGFWMILPLSYEYLKSKNFRVKNIRIDLLFLALLPLGFLAYGFYIYYLTGKPLALLEIQSAWGVKFTNPLRVLWQGLLSQKYDDVFATYFTIFFLWFLILSFKKLNFSHWLYGMYMILVPLTAGLEAIPRYILPVFPLYIAFAKFGESSKLDQIFTICLALLQGFLMVFWTMAFNLIV
jgi:hypothetical protein